MGEERTLTLDRVRADVLGILQAGTDEVGDEDDLVEAGLDSIRVMHLLERWRTEGVSINFVQLAMEPTIRGWHKLLNDKSLGDENAG
ncbi:isochorismatase [Amycolatopsis acidicola]|uniref:Isochorismatase n=1 Tax=Amycolatopsis acidicola TaxID=2596893 RepID=A0A5N0V2B3_9PSEU|nr:phosphopantetheine-binding protein [Amycolatopsis acidicola]KAA9159085.1 isochorismatase [Amycolatopsis acidicola]